MNIPYMDDYHPRPNTHTRIHSAKTPALHCTAKPSKQHSLHEAPRSAFFCGTGDRSTFARILKLQTTSIPNSTSWALLSRQNPLRIASGSSIARKQLWEAQGGSNLGCEDLWRICAKGVLFEAF